LRKIIEEIRNHFIKNLLALLMMIRKEEAINFSGKSIAKVDKEVFLYPFFENA